MSPGDPSIPPPRVSMPPTIPPRDTMPGRQRTSMGQLDEQPEVTAATAFALGFSAGRERILRRPTALAALLGAALVVVGALIERRTGAVDAVNRALFGTFRLVIPLVSFAVAADAASRGDLREAAWPIARYGASRRAVAAGLIVAAALASAALGAVFAVGSVALARGPGDLPLLRDAFQSGWIGALTAGAYVAWFSLGATFFRGGRGRWVPLVADFLVGGSTGVLGVLLPRGNAQNLLGGAAPLHLSQQESCIALLAMGIGLTIFAALRCRR